MRQMMRERFGRCASLGSCVDYRHHAPRRASWLERSDRSSSCISRIRAALTLVRKTSCSTAQARCSTACSRLPGSCGPRPHERSAPTPMVKQRRAFLQLHLRCRLRGALHRGDPRLAGAPSPRAGAGGDRRCWRSNARRTTLEARPFSCVFRIRVLAQARSDAPSTSADAPGGQYRGVCSSTATTPPRDASRASPRQPDWPLCFNVGRALLALGEQPGGCPKALELYASIADARAWTGGRRGSSAVARNCSDEILWHSVAQRQHLGGGR